MVKMLAGLGDRLLERLVPKTAAAACAGIQAEWFDRCYCAGRSHPYRCQWIGRICSNCGGITACTGCDYAQGSCYEVCGP